jgi:SAM-dependent methyltransferase
MSAPWASGAGLPGRCSSIGSRLHLACAGSISAAATARWIDIGCGNGAFTELLVRRCAPSETQGVDPSPAQLAFARSRPGARGAEFREGDAMALPFEAGRFDAAVMALVIFFVPVPAKGVAEMVRVVRPGGLVGTYAWDILGGGFPFAPIQAEVRAVGGTPALPPSVNVSRMEALRELWTGAGLEEVETREISVQRTFADFDDFWNSSTITTGMKATLATVAPGDLETIKARLRAKLPADPQGRITYGARANAVRGRMARLLG